MKRQLIQVFRVLVSAFFVFSAVAKLVTMAFFDDLVATVFIGESYYDHPDAFWWTQILARAIVVGELVLGIAILQPKWIKSLVLPTMTIMMVGFTAHLFYMGFTKGFVGDNCGCFGDILPMNNRDSIIKNVIAQIVILYIWRNYKEERWLEFRAWIPATLVGIVLFGTLLRTVKTLDPVEITDHSGQEKSISVTPPKGVEPAPADTLSADSTATDSTIDVNATSAEAPDNSNSSQTTESEPVNEPTVDDTKQTLTKSMYSEFTNFSNGTKVNLDEGRNLVCLFSLTCGHCQEAYKELCALTDNPKTPPIYLIVYGTPLDVGYFFQQAGCKHPYILVEEYPKFKKLLEGRDFPKISIRDAGSDTHTWDLESYDISSVKKALGIKVKKAKDDGLDIPSDNTFGTSGSGIW